MGYSFTFEDRHGKEEELGEEDGFEDVNVWGMQAIRAALGDTLDNTPFPPFRQLTQEEKDSEPPHSALYPETLEAVSPDPSKVPAHKFCSNDGWLVNPAQCLVLAEKLEKVLTPDHEDAWALSFAAGCREAAPRGGFRVW